MPLLLYLKFIFDFFQKVSEYLVCIVLSYNLTMRISSVVMFVHIDGYFACRYWQAFLRSLNLYTSLNLGENLCRYM
ncbi:MAG: hypothetical protein F6K40_10235 [Okeania sp. SIO3I5]|uniref:hypothetical protein n=1 Tax=Okeania sp. SIO3I5 TaxID=2607805 RepID=UPI0013B99E80|nr:hypothetical protein [Okeania sp. SIO3I5]NEQ36633.1 hypothetical protein [Okeania sp. SIO3I5]